MTSTNKLLNNYLKNKRIEKERFDDLKIVIEEVGYNEKILKWFSFLQAYEVAGWRPKLVTKRLCQILFNSNKKSPLEFYALFCPSYKKGVGVHGFRTDDVGNTSRWGIAKLKEIVEKSRQIGFSCETPRVVFFDIALEQPEKTRDEIEDLKKNIENLKRHIPKGMSFVLLSELFPFLFDTIGYKGVKIQPFPVPQITLNRIIERGRKFYRVLGWTQKQIKERSEVIASSEALVGNTIRYLMPKSIMIYTPTMLERAQVYSGYKFETDPLPIIFPQKEDEGL
ncbi:MAG: hypothetical protein ACOYT7_00315 [Patescibacteria group bacterium]